MLIGLVNKNIRGMADLGSCHPSFLPFLSPFTHLAFFSFLFCLFSFFPLFHPVLVEALRIIKDDDIFLGGLSSCHKTLSGTHPILSPSLPLPQSSFPVAFILFQPLASKILRTTRWFCHIDLILDFAPPSSFSISPLPPLHLYFCFNPQRFTSDLLKVKKLKWNTTNAHIETFHL